MCALMTSMANEDAYSIVLWLGRPIEIIVDKSTVACIREAEWQRYSSAETHSAQMHMAIRSECGIARGTDT